MQYLIEYMKAHVSEEICKFKVMGEVVRVIFHLVTTLKIINVTKMHGNNSVGNKKDTNLKL